MTTKTDTSDPLRKVAIFVSTLDRVAADDLLERLPSEQAAAVRNLVMRLEDVSEAEQERVAHEFLHGGSASNPPEDSGVELDDSLAEKLSSPNGYSDHVEQPAEPIGPPFHFLRQAETDAIAKHLAHENPQISAVVVAHLPPRQAANLIAHFEPARQADVLRRVSELDLADTAVVRDVEQHLEMLLSEDVRLANNRVAGLSAVAAILEAAGDKRDSLVSSLARHQNTLVRRMNNVRSRSRLPRAKDAATQVGPSHGVQQQRDERRTSESDVPTSHPAAEASRDRSLTFDDLSKLSDLALARIFRESDPQIALMALAGADASFVDRLMRQLPRPEAKSLRRRMESLGPLQLNDLAHAQDQIGELASHLAARGEIKVPAPARFTVAA